MEKINENSTKVGWVGNTIFILLNFINCSGHFHSAKVQYYQKYASYNKFVVLYLFIWHFLLKFMENTTKCFSKRKKNIELVKIENKIKK